MQRMTVLIFASLVFMCFACFAAYANGSGDVREKAMSNNVGAAYNYLVGVGQVDVTPEEPLPPLMGGASAMPAESVDLPLYVKAMVVSSGETKVAMVTLDLLKYPSSKSDLAAAEIAALTGIPEDNIMITASHTHSGPLYNYYVDSSGNDLLMEAIVQAVIAANDDLSPVKLGVATTEVTDISHNRRVLIDGEAWNDWFPSVVNAGTYPPAGPVDPQLQALVAVKQDGTYKAILWNYGAHPNSNTAPAISADYPGYVQQFMNDALGYEIFTLYATGACGDVNPSNNSSVIGQSIANKLVEALDNTVYIQSSSIYIDHRTIQTNGRENPVFAEEEITAKWPEMLEAYRSSFNSTLSSASASYETNITGIRIGDEFAIVTSPGELFASIGLDIKSESPFETTMVVEQTNGALGYIPAAADFALKGYETWYGEHSLLSVNAGGIIKSESLDILENLMAQSVPLKMKIYKVVDNRNVIVKFIGGEFYGATEVTNYSVQNALGEEQEILSVNSAFIELGGDEDALGTFRITLRSPLPPDSYAITVNHLTDALENPQEYAARTAIIDNFMPLSMSIYKVMDSKNFIVQFNREVYGATEIGNYSVIDSGGNVQAIAAATSAFDELGQTEFNVMRLTMASPLTEGATYTVKANQLTDRLTEPAVKYMATAPLYYSANNLYFSIYKIIDNQNIIVKFRSDVIGATDAANYLVQNTSEVDQPIASVVSAFVELMNNGESIANAANTFKITFQSPVAADTYTLTASNMTDAASGMIYNPSTVTLNSFAPLTMQMYQIMDSSNFIVRFNKYLSGYTDVENYTITDPNGNIRTISVIDSVRADLQMPNVFRITMASPLDHGVTYMVKADHLMENQTSPTIQYASTTVLDSFLPLTMDIYEVTDSSNFIVQFNRDLLGYTDVENYAITDPNGIVQTISAINSVWNELQVPNAFRITMASPLDHGITYTIKASQFVDNSTPTIKYMTITDVELE